MTFEQRVIDLSQFRSNNVMLLSGWERGQKVRDVLQLDVEDQSPHPVIVSLGTVEAVAESFFLGLFGKSIRTFESRKSFLAKYAFICSDTVFQEDIVEGINRALRTC